MIRELPKPCDTVARAMLAVAASRQARKLSAGLCVRSRQLILVSRRLRHDQAWLGCGLARRSGPASCSAISMPDQENIPPPRSRPDLLPEHRRVLRFLLRGYSRRDIAAAMLAEDEVVDRWVDYILRHLRPV